MAVIIVKLGDNVIQTFELGQQPAMLGRARDNDIVVENLSVSRHHAQIVFEEGKYVLIDNRSANGVFINGVKINRAELADNDIVSVGKHRLHYSATGSASKITQSNTQIDLDSPLNPIVGQDGIPRVPYLTVHRGNLIGLVYPLRKIRNTIGRSHQNDVRINDWLVSRLHASITYRDGSFHIEDQGSWHGTTVNSESVREKDLKAEDEILMGNSLMTFNLATPDEVIEDSKLFSFAQGFESPTNGAFLSLPISKVKADGATTVSQPVAADAVAGDDYEVSEGPEEDEFAPMTQEELEALETDADSAAAEFDVDLQAQAKFEELEAKKLQEEGGGWGADTSAPGLEEDVDMLKMESSNFEAPETADLLEDPVLAGDDDVHLEDAEEEKALFGGAIENVEPGSIDATPKPTKNEERISSVAVEKPKDDSQKVPAVSPPEPGTLVPVPTNAEELYIPEGVDPKQVRKWWHGLRNKKAIIRKQAASKLKELTGIDYDWESGS